MAAVLSITVVEDHDDLRALTVEVLRQHGHAVTGLASAEGVSGELLARTQLWLLDLNLPGEDGVALAERIRVAAPQVGIVMVTARTRVADRISGYQHGADLYLTKPVAVDELLAAVAALARRLPAAAAMALTLDSARLHLIGPAGPVALTSAEAALLAALASAPQRQLGLARIASALGQELHYLNKASLEVRIVRLRHKLTEAGAPGGSIKAVRGFGYQLCVPLLIVG